jgi:PLD-like domain
LDFVAGLINRKLLHNLTVIHTPECAEVRAAVAYADATNLQLFDSCAANFKPLTYYGRYDESVPVSSAVLKWFLDRKSLNFVCKLVPDFLHAKVIWWVGIGVYIGSANLTERAWSANIEAGVFVREEEMESSSLIEELRAFFDVVDARAHPIDDRLYKHLIELERLNDTLHKARTAAREKFESSRLLPAGRGLASVDRKAATDRAFEQFQRRWRQALQVLRDIAALVSADVNRPGWIPNQTPPGAQADQFIHAYYYKHIQGGLGGGRIDAAFERHRANPDAALRVALDWWRRSDFDFEHEKQTLLVWAPRLRELLAQRRLPTLCKEEFVEALSMVHAVIDYGGKRSNAELGLPPSQQSRDIKVRLHTEQLWEARTEVRGLTPLQVLSHVLWGSGEVESRIWTAARDPGWRLPWVQFSTLGEMLGWARPDEFPPRNDRTLKGLRALGYPVREV